MNMQQKRHIKHVTASFLLVRHILLVNLYLKISYLAVFNEDSVQKAEPLSLSNNTVSRRISNITNDIQTELISRLRVYNAYVLQLDESRDVAGFAILLVFVKHDFNTKIEDLFFCRGLKLHSTGNYIFNLIDNFMKTYDIGWKNVFQYAAMEQRQ